MISTISFAQVTTDSIAVTADGDTIIYYLRDTYDFGEIVPASDNASTEEDNVQPSPISLLSIGTLPSSIDQTKCIGVIPYEYGHTPNGGKTYTVPIYTAKVNGATPQVSLNYNSQGGNGIAGMGWGLAGNSAITLANKCIAFDGTVEGAVAGKNNQVFTLDGVRLVASNKLSNYTLETFQGQILVRPYVNNNSIVTHFTVKYPNGATATFGYPSGGMDISSVYAYPITNYTDLQGYRTDYEYTWTTATNNYLLSRINYGGRNAITHTAHIDFEYENRDDVPEMYIAGIKVLSNKKLKRIISYYGGEELRTYTLSYTLQGVNLLTQLDCSVGTSFMNPLSFAYGPTDMGSDNIVQGYSQILSSYFQGSQYNWDFVYNRGRFQRDDYNDGLIVYPVFPIYTVTHYNTRTGEALYGSGYPDDQDLLIAPRLGNGYHTPRIIQTGAGFQLLTAVDINGDNVDELLKVNFSVQNTKTKLSLTTYTYNNGMFSPSTGDILIEGIVQGRERTSPMPRFYLFGDFTGNGKIEMLTISHDKRPDNNETCTSYFALINLETKTLIREQSSNSQLSRFSENDQIRTFDYNGDGKADILRISENGLEVYTYANNGFIKAFTNTSMKEKKISIADINGDGYSDLIIPPPQAMTRPKLVYGDRCGHEHYYELFPSDPEYEYWEGFAPGGTAGDYGGIMFPGMTHIYKCNTCDNVFMENETMGEDIIEEDSSTDWMFYLSDGKGGFQSTTIPIIYNYKIRNCLFQDLNGDGLQDMIIAHSGTIDIFLNNKGYFSSMPTDTYTSAPHLDLTPFNETHWAGTSQWVTVEGPQVITYSWNRNEGLNRSLTRMTDSHGLLHSNSYSTLTSMSDYSIGTVARQYPYTSIIMPLNLLQYNVVQTGSTKLIDEGYRYYGAVAHLNGYGFCGFEEVKTTDYRLGVMQTVVGYNPELFGVTTRIDAPAQTITYTYRSNQSGLFVNPRVLSSIEIDKLRADTIRTDYGYDQYYTVSNKIITWGDHTDSHIAQSTQSSSIRNTINSSLYLLGVPMQSEAEDFLAEYGNEQGTKETIEYTSNYQPKKRIKEVLLDNFTEIKKWEYDDNSLLVSEQTGQLYNTGLGWGEEPFMLEKSYTYDNKGRMLTQTDELGRTTQYAGYNKYGNPTQVTDYLGGTTTYTFDEWGRQIAVAYPDNRRDSILCDWDNSVGLYCITQRATGNPAKRTYYDTAGREVRVSNQCFDGSWQHVDMLYDAGGRLWKESLPFKSTSATLWNEYSYDNHDRPLSLTEPSGKTTTHSYSGMSEIIVNNGISSTHTYNSRGQTTSVSDPGGTINYTYRADRQLEATTLISDSQEITTTFEYDIFGQRIAINDPSAGRTTYSDGYSVAGIRTTAQTDANGNTVRMVYDVYGRPTSKTTKEFSTTYTYDSTTRQIASETSTNGTSTHATYDALGRPATLKEVAPGNVWFQQAYVYNTDGMLSRIDYSSSAEGLITSEYMYYTHGHLSCRKFGRSIAEQQPLWELTEENELGQPTRVTTNSLVRTYGYDSYGLPTFRDAKTPQGTVKQHFTCQFNALTGNLQTRYSNGNTEHFTYDNLNRLVANGYISNSNLCQYDAKGNIIQMPKTGDMAYAHTQKPYAITDLTSPNSRVAKRDQNITYTSFQRPAVISENGYIATFTYNASGERVSMQMAHNGSIENTTYYLGGCYEKNNTTSRLYLMGGYYSSPVVLVKQQSQSWMPYEICRDHLGSITHVYSSTGTLIQESSYDAWGRLREADNLDIFGTDYQPTLFLGRGFTGHEHLPQFGLINMNARLYDPALGRFLSPDPYVQEFWNTQSFNRYAYCMNNPLVYVDQNGEFWFIIGGALIGAYIGASLKSKSLNPKKWSSDWWKGALIGGAVGGLAGWTIGGMWAAGAPLKFGLGLSNPITLFTFNNITAAAGSYVVLTIGSGLGLGTGITLTFGKKEEHEYTESQYQALQRSLDDWSRKNNPKQGFDWQDYTSWGTSTAKEVMYSETTGSWLGKNGKRYSTSWGGNQYTGGKYQFAKKWANRLGRVSSVLGIYGIATTLNDRREGRIDNATATVDLTIGIISMMGPYGAWAGFWAKMGQEYGPMHRYFFKK
jgi:RHS repeat-associated protein